LIVRDLAAGPRRFVELQRVLPGISTEQLRSRLNRMVADGMLTRKRYREVPPRVDYALTERGSDLMPILGALARWGVEGTWSAPRPSEAIDVGAIFRLAPGAVKLNGYSGTVEAIVESGGEQAAYTFTVAPSGTQVEERAADRADVRISGDTGAWIRAMSPEHIRDGLRISGDESLAIAILAALGGEAAAAEAGAAAVAS